MSGRGRTRGQSNLFSDSRDGFIALQGFERWWAIMMKTEPRNPRMNAKPKCRRRWDVQGLERIADTIIANTLEKKRTFQWRDGYPPGQFQPEPYKYLYNEMWTDPVGPIDDGLRNADPLTRAAVREGNVNANWEDD